MSYDTYEQSAASGEPVELYDIYDDHGEHWRYCTGSETVTYGGYDYEAAVIDRSDVEMGPNAEVEALTVKMGRSNPLTNTFISEPIEGLVSLTLYRQHAAETAVYWQGVLTSVTFDKDGIPSCRFEPLSSDSANVGHRRCNQRLCDWALYSDGCGVEPADFDVAGVIAGITGLDISAVAFGTKPDGWFTGGEIVVGNARRLITNHVTTTITVSRSILSAEVGDSFTAYAGCDHTPTTCGSKFGNKLNYGGNEFLPVKNPYAGSIKY